MQELATFQRFPHEAGQHGHLVHAAQLVGWPPRGDGVHALGITSWAKDARDIHLCADAGGGVGSPVEEAGVWRSRGAETHVTNVSRSHSVPVVMEDAGVAVHGRGCRAASQGHLGRRRCGPGPDLPLAGAQEFGQQTGEAFQGEAWPEMPHGGSSPPCLPFPLQLPSPASSTKGTG